MQGASLCKALARGSCTLTATRGPRARRLCKGTSSCTDRIHANSLHMDVVRGSSSCKALVKGTVEPRARHCVSSWSQGPNVRRWCEVLVQGSGARLWCKAHPRVRVSLKGLVQVLVQGMATGLLVQGPRARLEVLIGSLWEVLTRGFLVILVQDPRAGAVLNKGFHEGSLHKILVPGPCAKLSHEPHPCTMLSHN